LAVEPVRRGLAGSVCSDLFEVFFAPRRGDGGIASSFKFLFSWVSALLKILFIFIDFDSRAWLIALCLAKAAASILAETSMGSAIPIASNKITSIEFFII